MYSWVFAAAPCSGISLAAAFAANKRLHALLLTQLCCCHPYPLSPSIHPSLPPGPGTVWPNTDAKLESSCCDFSWAIPSVLRKSSKTSLDGSCRACKRASRWCKIRCGAQLSKHRNPGGVPETSTVSAGLWVLLCKLREHWLEFFAKCSVWYNIYSNRKKQCNYKASDSYHRSKYEETGDKTRRWAKPESNEEHSKHLQEFQKSHNVSLRFHFFFPLFLEKQSCGAVRVPGE